MANHGGTSAFAASHSSASSTTAVHQDNDTFVMASSPVANRKRDAYKPRIITTVGAKPACLVNASVTYVGNEQIYAFGGFDQYTDEVYNHVLRLNLISRQWNLVDNFGDIPGVRMGHTACLWQGDKLVVFGGENEHRAYLSDVIIFDIKTAHWTQPEVQGPIPRGRARHSAVIHDEKLYISGGITGVESIISDDICYLDLKTWTWSRSWRFVPRYDHTSWVWNGRIWVFGGIGEESEKSSELWWLDIRGSPTFEAAMAYGSNDRQALASKSHRFPNTSTVTGTTGYLANSSSIQVGSNQLLTRAAPLAPGSISSLKFVFGPDLPVQNLGTHFHVFSSGQLLDFATPASSISSHDSSLSSLDLDLLRWQKLAEGKELFDPAYRWHYCTLNEDGTQAWLLGCPTETTNGGEEHAGEYLSDVLPIDLTRYGLLGNSLALEAASASNRLSLSDTMSSSSLSGIGADLARCFDQPPETGSGADFIVTGERDGDDDSDVGDKSGATFIGSPAEVAPQQPSKPIHVHRMILQARWPHFARLWNAQMSEFHTKKLHIPEPYSAVRAFLYYLYTDSIAADTEHGPDLQDVAGLLVMANIYDMPRLRVFCINRLVRELDVEHAAIIWERAGTAQEEWLRRRAAAYCMMHWGRVVRTEGFRTLPRQALLDLCEEVDVEGRVMSGEELEAIGGLGGSRIVSGIASYKRRQRSQGSVAALVSDDMDDEDADGEEGMDVN